MTFYQHRRPWICGAHNLLSADKHNFNITIIVAKASLIDRYTQQGFGIIDVDTAAEGFKRQWCRQEHFRCQMKQERFSCAVCRGYCIETTEKKYIVIDWQKGG